jgi:acetylornithine deacetylase/succinyl-diaminopimelate desuccinylase-like protein
MSFSEADDVARKRRHRRERIVAAIIVLLVALLAAAAAWWARSEEEKLAQDRGYIPKVARITPEVLLLQELVRIDTSHPKGAADAARWVAAYLRTHGVAAELIESGPNRINVYARIRGRERGGALLLFSHLDVVPAGEGWTRPPFEGGIGLNMMYGRGTLDMKALMLCQLLAIADIARNGRPPAHDLVFLGTADEETGSEFGMRWIIANRPDVLEGVAFGITEGGITEMMKERLTYFGIEVGGKQRVELTLEGDDVESLRQARFALEPHMFPREPERVIPVVRQYFRDIAPTRVAFRSILGDVDQAIAKGDFWRLPIAYRDLTQNSLWVTAPLLTDGKWSMTVTQANLPDEIPEQRVAWLQSIVAPYGVRVGEIRAKEGPVPISSSATPLFAILAKEAERRYSVRAGLQVLYRSATDARFLRPLGITCYGVSPYPVDFFQSLSIHGANERIRLDFFMDGVAYMKNVVHAWANGA